MTELTQEQKNQMLREAAKAGDAEVMETALLNGAEIDAKDDYGYTALIFAAYSGLSDVCQMLIGNGASIDAKNEKGYTALIWAAINGHREICQMLIAKGADIDEKNNNGDTALILAVRYGHSETCQMLIGKGADIDAKNKYGFTALISADTKSHCDTGKWLLRYGAGHDGSYRRINYWRAQMSEAARAAFPGNGAEILATACFTDGRVSEAILDACATGQFGRLVAAPLIKSTKPADRQLFKEVWDKLPRYWQDQYETLYVEFIKSSRSNLKKPDRTIGGLCI